MSFKIFTTIIFLVLLAISLLSLFFIFPVLYQILQQLPSTSAERFIDLITSAIDIMAVAVVIASIIQSIHPFMNYTVKISNILGDRFTMRDEDSDSKKHSSLVDIEKKAHKDQNRYRIAKKNFIRGLLLSLELECANAILKMGVFTSALTVATQVNSTMSSVQPISLSINLISTHSGFSNFMFFLIILSVRIAISQTLHRFG